jgi:hypothetical protein
MYSTRDGVEQSTTSEIKKPRVMLTHRRRAVDVDEEMLMKPLQMSMYTAFIVSRLTHNI